MTLPASIGSASHFDQGTDDPKQARAQLKQIRDDIETINDHLKLSPFISPATPLGIGNGLEASGGNLVAKLDGTTLGLSANGLKVADDAIDLAQMAHGTAGDLVFYDVSGVPTRLPKGSDDQILTLASGLPAWANAGSNWSEISGSPFSITGGTNTGTTLSDIFDGDPDRTYKVLFLDVQRTGGTAGATFTAFLGGSEQTSHVYLDSDNDQSSSLNSLWHWAGGISHGTDEGLMMELIVDNPAQDHGIHFLRMMGHSRAGSTGPQNFFTRMWGIRAAGALNGLKMTFTSGHTIDKGSCRVFKK